MKIECQVIVLQYYRTKGKIHTIELSIGFHYSLPVNFKGTLEVNANTKAISHPDRKSILLFTSSSGENKKNKKAFQ